MRSVFAGVENIVGKGENAGNQQFPLFPQCFQKPSLLGVLKVRIFFRDIQSQDCHVQGYLGLLCGQKVFVWF